MQKRKKKFIPPLNDYVVKCVYGDQGHIANTEGLLKPILGIPPEDYENLSVGDPFLKRRSKDDKLGILDIRLTTKSGRIVDVEVQTLFFDLMPARILFYNAKMLAGQMKSGFGYDRIRQTICVLITDYELLSKEDRPYLNTFELRSGETGELFTELQKYIILELPRVPEEDDGHPIWPHLRFLKCKTEEEMAMLLKEHPEVEPVVAEYQEISMSEQRRRRAEYREKQRRDACAALEHARNEGRAELAPVIAEQAQVIAEKDRVIAELNRMLQDKGGI